MNLRKIIFLVSVLIAGIVRSNAQEVNETAYLLCTYKTISITDTNKKNKGKQLDKDLVGLEIGETSSRYFSINYAEREKENTEIKNSSDGGRGNFKIDLSIIDKLGTPLIIYKNHKTQQIISIDGYGWTNKFTFDEPIPIFKWEVLPDTITIINHICQKATCQFKGRTYEAWFAQNISISEGPWKFVGLPGLILKITDSKKPIDAQKVSKEKFTKLYKNYLENPAATSRFGEAFKNINRIYHIATEC
jgi:GLPGLI family protein